MEFSAMVDERARRLLPPLPGACHRDRAPRLRRRWPDLTDAGRDAACAWLADDRRSLVEALVRASSLADDEAIDRRILLEYLGAARFGEETLDEETWNPLGYVYLFGNGLFSLLAREFAPAAGAAAKRRVAHACPAGGTRPGARRRCSAGGQRPVSRFHTEKAVERMLGLLDLARYGGRGGGGRRRRRRCATRWRRPPSGARGHHAASASGCATSSCRPPTGDFRLGAELYAAEVPPRAQDRHDAGRAGAAGRIGL